MKKIALSIMLLFNSGAVFPAVFLDTSLGFALRDLRGDEQSYKSNQSLLADVSAGYQAQSFVFSLDGSVLFGRQKEMTFDYGNTVVSDDFNWFTINVGPTLGYFIPSEGGSVDYQPFIGIFYSHNNFTNSVDLTDEVTGRFEDAEHQSDGYGVKLGIKFLQQTALESWLDSVNYKIYASYTKQNNFEGDYLEAGRLKEYRGDAPDNLEDYTIGFSVGFRLGDKLWSQTKNFLGIF